MNILNKKINWEKLEWEDEQRTIQEGKQEIKTDSHLILKHEDREITQIDIPSLGVDPDESLQREHIDFSHLYEDSEKTEEAKMQILLALKKAHDWNQRMQQEFGLARLRPFDWETEEQWKDRRDKYIEIHYGRK